MTAAWRVIKDINPYKIVVVGFDVIRKLKVDSQFVRGEEGGRSRGATGNAFLTIAREIMQKIENQ